jgi:AraC family transcriptional regulator of adaptative response/methylated-DNA-[protein]-cysteine methyltransferase
MDETRYWQAMVDRDRKMDGEFVYGVRSTGVYCRASCPSRRPGREQVVFFAGPEEAEVAGFRACLRCHPRGRVEPELGVEMAEKASRFIEERLEQGESRITLEELGKAVGTSPYHLQRVFKRVMGVTPRQYTAAMRLERLKAGLRDGENVTGAMYDAGYGSANHLYGSAGAQMGMTPGAYRQGGLGMDVRYTVADSALGKVLVAATERGLCAVHFGDSDETLLVSLRGEYPAARVARDDAGMAEWVRPILCQIEERKPYLDGRLPLDVEGTPFQEQVWSAIRGIPYGSTRSYGEIAEAIGSPKAVRAVAQACGANHVALVIPCHRVVRENGSMGGYRWGVERKRALLAGEQVR